MVFPAYNERIKNLPFSIFSSGLDHVQEPIRRPEGYHTWQWIQVQKGRAWFESPQGKWELKPGEGLFLHPLYSHSYHCLGNELVVDWLAFEGSAIEALIKDSVLQQPGVFQVLNPSETRSIVRECYLHASGVGLLEGFNASLAVYRLLLALLSQAHAPGQEAAETRNLRLQPVLEYMETHLHTPLSLEDLSSIILVSPAHLNRLFRKHLGESPLSYLIKYRIDRSKSLLLGHPEMRINEIAGLVGYEDENYFTRMFRSRTGMSPRAFRELHGYS